MSSSHTRAHTVGDTPQVRAGNQPLKGHEEKLMVRVFILREAKYRHRHDHQGASRPRNNRSCMFSLS